MVKTICLRLNLEKPLHRQAWEYLQSMDKDNFKSYSNAIALSVEDYFRKYYKKCDDPYFETREREERFVAEILEAVEKAVEKAMPSFIAACFTNINAPVQAIPAQSEETTDISDVDLDFLGE